MGFGSYDESEQEKQELDTDQEDDAEQVSRSEEADADGDVDEKFPDGGTDAMLDQLRGIKREPEE